MVTFNLSRVFYAWRGLNHAAHFLNCAEKGVCYAQKIQQKSYCGVSHTVLGSDFARCVRDNMYGAEFDFLFFFQIGLIVFYKPITLHTIYQNGI